MAGSVEITGLKEFRRALRAIGPQSPEALKDAHKRLADKGAEYARAAARSMGGIQARAASAIGGRGDERAARVAVLPSSGGRDKMANVAFWGALRHTGWYAAPRYQESTAQHPPWVGADWDVAVRGEGPYAINDALADNLDELLDEYGRMLDELVAFAFPDGAGSRAAGALGGRAAQNIARGASGASIAF